MPLSDEQIDKLKAMDRRLLETVFLERGEKIDEQAARIAELEAERDKLRADRELIASLLRVQWSFDEAQQHTHNWHDREDFMEWLLGKDTDSAARIESRADAHRRQA